jgi:starch synthase
MKVKKEKSRVVLVTTEIVPYSKVGGLADVMGALPDELEKLGCGVTIITPLYSSIDRSEFGIERIPRHAKLTASVGTEKVTFALYGAKKPGTSIDVYFVESERFYGRKGIYTVPETGEAFDDEAERTVFFNRAVIESIKALDMHPDVIHCNDFHSGLIPAYLGLGEGDDPHFEGTGTVFSVHNLAYQGIFEPSFLDMAGLGRELFTPGGPFEFWGRVNVMKIGLVFSGLISTVSKTYAKEITTTDEFGYGLEGVLRSRKKDLVGILNGIDPDAWNPETDDLIPANFTASDQKGKEKCCLELHKAFRLKPSAKAPVVGMVSRLVDQKGFDILAEAVPALMKLDVRFAILGTGQQKYHDLYKELEEKYSKRFGVRLEFNNELAHLIEAGSDYFLMPSRYEPCGLNQMYSLRYGTIPIVRATGGLKDTIKNLDSSGSKGNGFTFTQYSAGALSKAISKAVNFFGDPNRIRRVRERIMQEDHAWKRSAEEYQKLYERAAGRIGMRLTTR